MGGEEFRPPAWAGSEADTSHCVCVYRGDVLLEVYKFSPRKCYLTLGQDKRLCDVFLNNLSADAVHAALVWDTRNALFVLDLNSSEGSFLNGEKLTAERRTRVNVGDVLVFGKSTRQFKIENDVELALENLEKAKAEYKKRKRDAQHDSNGSHKVQKHDQKAAKESTGPKVRVRHLLVKHAQSRKPSSWREAEISRSLADAEELVREYQEQLQSVANQGEDVDAFFSSLASKYSDCSSAKRGGDLGEFGRGKMQPNFEAAAFALKPGSLSDLVYSDSGVHIIYRIS